MAADDVQLPDLEVIQRFSLAVRGATAPRADVVAALQSDLAWLTGDGASAAAPAQAQSTGQPSTAAGEPNAAPRKRAPRRAVPATPRKRAAAAAGDAATRSRGHAATRTGEAAADAHVAQPDTEA